VKDTAYVTASISYLECARADCRSADLRNNAGADGVPARVVDNDILERGLSTQVPVPPCIAVDDKTSCLDNESDELPECFHRSIEAVSPNPQSCRFAAVSPRPFDPIKSSAGLGRIESKRLSARRCEVLNLVHLDDAGPTDRTSRRGR
jgi:hypothetical protein